MKLELSTAVTFDTLYGGSFPDGRYFAFGAADTSVRVIETSGGKQVVYMAGHDDWVRDIRSSAWMGSRSFRKS